MKTMITVLQKSCPKVSANLLISITLMANVKNTLLSVALSKLSTKMMDGVITVTPSVISVVTTLVSALSAKTTPTRFKACIVYALRV